MTTTEKIAKLGKLYRAAVNSRDIFAVCEDTTPEEREELLTFVCMVKSQSLTTDATLGSVIEGLAGLLLNDIHTASGY